MLCNRPDTPLEVPISVGASALLSDAWFLGFTPLSFPNSSSISSAVFAGLLQSVPTLYHCLPFPPKLHITMGNLDPHLIYISLGPPKYATQTASWSVQPFLQISWLWQTDKPTDHATHPVTIGRIYICSTANVA